MSSRQRFIANMSDSTHQKPSYHISQYLSAYVTQKCASRQDPSALKELLQKPPQQYHQQQQSKTFLSPNGTFKYVKRQNAKSFYNSYNAAAALKPIFQDRVRRPLNCFMVFSHLERRRVAEQHPELHNADLSKILGRRWKTLTPLQKQPYIDEAERIRQLHTEIYPDYKYQPRRKSQIKRTGKKVDTEEAQPEEKQKSENGGSKVDESFNQHKKQPVTDTKDEEEKFVCGKDNTQQQSQLTSLPTTTTTTVHAEHVARCYQSNTTTNNNNISHYHQINNHQRFNYLTPASSPYYGHQEQVYNHTTPSDAQYSAQMDSSMLNEPLRSFPPTPEMSPIMINREETAFPFDMHQYISNGLPQQSLVTSSGDEMLGDFPQAGCDSGNNDGAPLEMMQQHENQQMFYQNYYQMESFYSGGAVPGYHQQQDPFTAVNQQQDIVRSNLQKNEMSNSFSNLLDSLQNPQ